MNNGLVLIVDELVREQKQFINVATGKVQHEQVSAEDLCKKRNIRYVAMTPQLKSLVLFARKERSGDASGNVTLGDYGPFVLARIENGELLNNFKGSDFAKPMKLSSQSVMALAEIFGGKRNEIEA